MYRLSAEFGSVANVRPLLPVTNEYLNAEAGKLTGYVNNQVALSLLRDFTVEASRQSFSLEGSDKESFEVMGEVEGVPDLVAVLRRRNTLSYVNREDPRRDFDLQVFAGTDAGVVRSNPRVLLSPDRRPESLARIEGFDDVNLKTGLYIGDAKLSYGQTNESLRNPSGSFVWLHRTFLPATLQFRAVR